MNSMVMHLYNRANLSFERGQGVWLYDTSGQAFLDTHSGLGVCGLGHAHPNITAAIKNQAEKLLHVSNGYIIPEQEKLAKRICQLVKMSEAFFCNSGAEANETALKLAHRYAYKNNIESPKIIVFERSYHGRTLGALSATGNMKIRNGFEPLFQHFVRLPFGDIDAVKNAFLEHSNIVAIHVEPILGNAGIIIPPDSFLLQLRTICDEHNCLLMFDEVQTGLARTGTLFAFEHENIIPDVLCIAKALGNGIPIGACLIEGKAKNLFEVGSHGSTFGGNPFACSVALSVLDVIEQQQVCANSKNVGHYLLNLLTETFAGRDYVKEIRGKGLMIGVEFNKPTEGLNKKAIKNNLLINLTGINTVRFLPPLILKKEEAETLAEKFTKTCDEFFNS